MRISVLLCLLFSGLCRAAELPLQTVTEIWAPYNTYSSEQTADGAHALAVQQLLQRAALPDTINILPWARSMGLALNRPNTLIFSLARTPEREPLFIWLAKLSNVQQFLWQSKESKAQAKTLQDAADCCHICTLRKDISETHLRAAMQQPDKHLILADSHADCLRLLRGGDVDFMAGSIPRIEYLLHTEKLASNTLKRSIPLAAPNPLYLAANLQTDKKILAKLQQQIKLMEDSGELQRLIQRALQRPPL